MFYPVSLILKSLPIYNRLEMFRALLDKKFAIRVKGSRLNFSFYLFLFSFSFILNLELEISMILHVTVTVTQSHITH